MGDGWTPEVWENCGWHYRATKGVAAISPNCFGGVVSGDWNITGYTVYFNTAHQFDAGAETAEDALGFAIQEARGIERTIAADCTALLA
jgi:hypothetical protein